MARISALLAALTLVGCSAGGSTPERSAQAASYELPFGLHEVEGTSSVGRPAAYEDVLFFFKDQPVEGTRLRAAYLVSGSDPIAVFQQWVDQLALLPLDDVAVSPGQAATGQWLTAFGTTTYRPDKPSGASAELQLWATAAGPVLLVDISVVPGADPARPSVPTVPNALRPTTDVDSDPARAGEVLFAEKRQPVHLPDGTRGLLGTIPTPAGTGGSFTVVATKDAEKAVRALLDEAKTYAAAPDVRGPTSTVQDGVRVVRADFDIPGGGWGFDVVSVQADDDAEATLFVSSDAD